MEHSCRGVAQNRRVGIGRVGLGACHRSTSRRVSWAETVPSNSGPRVPTPTTAATSQPGVNGSFRVEYKLSHRAQVDPIVAPGTTSAHMHDFFGNGSTAATSTYASMQAASSNCTEPGDTAGYWSPTLVAPNGTYVDPERSIFYYRNRPYDYGTTVAFPVRSSAWSWAGRLPTRTGRATARATSVCPPARLTISPDRGPGGKIKLHVFFPSCWDGVHLHSPDHRSHVVFGLDEDGGVDTTDPDTCPASHPIKVPQLDFPRAVRRLRRHRLSPLRRHGAGPRGLLEHVEPTATRTARQRLPRTRRSVLRPRVWLTRYGSRAAG